MQKVCFFLIVFICGYVFWCFISYAIDKYQIIIPYTSIGLADIEIESKLHEHKSGHCYLDETEEISTIRVHSRDSWVVSEFGNEYLICRRKLAKNIGEDLRFVCKWNTWYFDFMRNLEYKAKWTLNGSYIMSKDPITMTCGTIGHCYADVISISSIKDNRFWKYQLWFSFNSINSTCKNFTMMEIMIAQMYLWRAKDIISYFYSPVENAVLLRYNIPFSKLSTLLPDGNISIKYEIYSKLIGKTTLNNQFLRFKLGYSIFTTIALWKYKINRIEFVANHPNKYFSICLCTPSIALRTHSYILLVKLFLTGPIKMID